MRTIEVERINLNFCTYREAKRHYDYWTSLGAQARVDGMCIVFEVKEPVIGRAKVM